VADLSDEVLMAHADGELEPEERARVDRILVADPVTRARWAKFQATGKTLANLVPARADDPVPQHLVDLVLASNGASSHPIEAYGGRSGWLRLRTAAADFFAPDRRLMWGPALAYSTVLLVGACAGWLLHDMRARPKTAPTVVVQRDGRILAQGALQRALETATSGVQVDSTSGLEERAAVRIRLSFWSKHQAFCRQYDLALGSEPSRFSGVACRGNDEHWQVQVHLPVERHQPGGGKVTPAGLDNPVAAFVDRMSANNALDGPGEAAAIRNRWRADLAPN
jgi:anti-sigma factor RsiW